MTKQGAEKSVIISALVVAGVYAYRNITEGTDASTSGVNSILGIGPPVKFGKFVTAWAFTFFVISLITEAAPQLGGSFAILVTVGDLLTNTQSISKDVNKAVNPVGAAVASTAQQAHPTATATMSPSHNTVNPGSNLF